MNDKDHMSALRIKNTSESDLRSYEVTYKQLQIKPRTNSEAPDCDDHFHLYNLEIRQI